VPYVGQVSGPSPRNDEQCIDADVIAVAHVARREPFRGDDHAPQPPFVERDCGGFLGRARLHFDECERAAAPSDNVDLAAPHPRSTGKDLPAVKS
jgi:hypothetical protein